MNPSLQPLVSVVIPTLNSAATLPLTLRSLTTQTYPRERLEMLVVDGGSTDATRDIARQFQCRILENPQVQQEHAKHIGLLQAAGAYIIFLDSDEEFASHDAVTRRVAALEGNPAWGAVLTGGYIRPAQSSPVNDYINTFSDPFAFFIYRVSTDHRFFLASLRRCYGVTQETTEWVCFQFRDSDRLPLVDMCAGHMVRAARVRQAAGDRWTDPTIMPRLFYLLTAASKQMIVLNKDAIVHHSADSLGKFLRKLRWRVIANIHYPAIPGTGFANREEFQPASVRYKKYLFIPYALTVVLPLWESIWYAAHRRMPINLLHLPLTVYTATLILWQYGRKLVGSRPRIRSYGTDKHPLPL